MMPDVRIMSVRRNTVIATVCRMITMALGFVVTPTLLNALGAERFGLYAVITSIQGYFGIFDFGIGGGLSRFMTIGQERGDMRVVRRITAFGILFYILLFLVLLPFVCIAIPHLVDWLRVRPFIRASASRAIFLVFLLFILSSVSGVISARIYAAHRMDVVSIASLVSSFCYVAALLYVMHIHASLLAAVTCLAVPVTVVILINGLATLRYSPGLVGNPFLLDRSLIKQLFSFGWWTQLNSASAIVNLEADKVIIGRWLGVGRVAPYQVANRIASLCRVFPLQLLGALFPNITARISKGMSPQETALLYVAASRGLMLGTVSIIGLLIALSPTFVRSWIGHDVPGAPLLADALLVSYGVNNLTGIGTTILRAEGRPKYETYYAIGSAALNIALTIAFISRFGLLGVVGGTIVANVMGSLAFVILFHVKRKFALWPTLFSWLIPLMAAAACASTIVYAALSRPLLYTLNRMIGLSELVIATALYTALLLLFLVAFGYLSRTDIVGMRRLCARILRLR